MPCIPPRQRWASENTACVRRNVLGRRVGWQREHVNGSSREVLLTCFVFSSMMCTGLLLLRYTAIVYGCLLQPLYTAIVYGRRLQPLYTAIVYGCLLQPLYTAIVYGRRLQPLYTAIVYGCLLQPLYTAIVYGRRLQVVAYSVFTVSHAVQQGGIINGFTTGKRQTTVLAHKRRESCGTVSTSAALAGTGGRGEMGYICTRAVHHPQRVLQSLDSFYRHTDSRQKPSRAHAPSHNHLPSARASILKAHAHRCKLLATRSQMIPSPKSRLL
ncbi:uncharacterized protein M421DRAFT_243913 [Didymella exigua CBS 183.55]|uniref:Uncharacterized protein n=1 Tax=Didymella exigua CBS 183.55 TaxID=1150837 RepID=A0A6A5RYE4_9PLEO|nr:uncharacterized protein M421DRAFT_243913 [Didymella exigua CBS 183.55]KAF1932549.1 hypothetical protein M421DRAFT_243913 [Didymella exigua CBS 183.55]